MQIVTVRGDIMVGQTALIALPGAVLQNGKTVNREKISGEWSEGSFIDIIDIKTDMSSVVDDATCVCLSEDDDSDLTSSVEYQVLPCQTFSNENVQETLTPSRSLHYVNGDASKAQFGKGKKVITHVCNDMGRWGKGFVMAITDTWGKHPGRLYRKWHKAGAKFDFALGRAQIIPLTDMIHLANIIGQNGIKTGSKGPPVRYDAIELGLDSVCLFAAANGASVHMPRIGSGLAGGEWAQIEAIVESMVKKHGVDIYVYTYNV